MVIWERLKTVAPKTVGFPFFALPLDTDQQGV